MGCFFLSGCVKPKTPEPKNIMQPTTALLDGLKSLTPEEVKAQEDTLGDESYRIIVDDGFGMKGFVATHCQSYRAVITAIAGVSMSSESTCVRASDLVNDFPSSQSAAKKFFEEAVNETFFQPKSNSASAIIREIAEEYQDNPNQVLILISDLMIPTEDDCALAAKALQDAVITPEHATMGIISIKGDFRGAIENLPVSPTTGYIRKISDYMVIDKDARGNFKHPLYVLFIGDDQAVLNAMEKTMTSLKNSSSLDSSNELNALYFTEYGITRRAQDDITTTFNLGYPDYNDAGYPAYFLFRGVNDASGKVKYAANSVIEESYQQKLADVPFAKIYTLERGTSENNVKIRCTVPYSRIDSSTNGATIIDTNGLVKTAGDMKLTSEDYTVTADLYTLDYSEGKDGTAKADWVAADPTIVTCESKIINADCNRVDVTLTVHTAAMGPDESLVCKVLVHIAAKPSWESIQALYDTQWVSDISLNLTNFDNESLNMGGAETSARFTEATTARTPFFKELINVGICEEQMKQVLQNLTDQTAACVEVAMFGIVVRDVPVKYDQSYSWDEKESFGGWAFSEDEAAIIRLAFKQ